MILIRIAVRVENRFAGIYAGIVGFIVNEEQWEIGHDASTGLLLDGICDVVRDPSQQALKNCLVLLDYKQPRSLFRCNPEIASGTRGEITIVGPICREVWTNCGIAVDIADANDCDFGRIWFGFIAQKALIKAHLRL